jgi:hypothetical protein
MTLISRDRADKKRRKRNWSRLCRQETSVGQFKALSTVRERGSSIFLGNSLCQVVLIYRGQLRQMSNCVVGSKVSVHPGRTSVYYRSLSSLTSFLCFLEITTRVHILITLNRNLAQTQLCYADLLVTQGLQTTILSSHLWLCLSSGLLFSGYPIKILYAFLISHMHCTRATNFILLHLPTVITSHEEHRLWSSSLCNFLHPPFTSFHLAPNNSLRTLLSQGEKSGLADEAYQRAVNINPLKTDSESESESELLYD